jgi:hypothetical protein
VSIGYKVRACHRLRRIVLLHQADTVDRSVLRIGMSHKSTKMQTQWLSAEQLHGHSQATRIIGGTVTAAVGEALGQVLQIRVHEALQALTPALGARVGQMLQKRNEMQLARMAKVAREIEAPFVRSALLLQCRFQVELEWRLADVDVDHGARRAQPDHRAAELPADIEEAVTLVGAVAIDRVEHHRAHLVPAHANRVDRVRNVDVALLVARFVLGAARYK